jgi:hypothetical protein
MDFLNLLILSDAHAFRPSPGVPTPPEHVEKKPPPGVYCEIFSNFRGVKSEPVALSSH